MRRSRLVSPVAAGCVIGLIAAPPAAAQRAVTQPAVTQRAARPATIAIRVDNPLAIERPDETIAVRWPTVLQQLPGAAPDRVRVLDAATGREVVAQVIDNDGDGRPDELLFQTSFWPNESKAFVVEPVASALKPESRVHTRHDEPRDDVAWESDRIAFRIYGQGLKKTSAAMSSSGIDVWVKKVRTPILEKWYAKGHDAYHVDTGEGADFYDVNETLGTGGTAVWRNDSLFRADNFTGHRILADGPIRTLFQLEYAPWNAGGQQVSETKRIAIDAGQNLYRQESVFRTVGADGGAGQATVPYAIGVVKRPGLIGSESKAQPWAWLAAWGPVSPKLGGHGEMGSAVLLERSRVVDWKETGDHYLAVANATSGTPAVHYIGAGWTDSGDFRDVEAWWRYLDEFAQRLATPVKVTLAPNATAAAR